MNQQCFEIVPFDIKEGKILYFQELIKKKLNHCIKKAKENLK